MKKTLRFWIMLLITFTMICILGIASISGYFVAKENLENDYLKMNKVYSMKLAQLTEEVFNGMQSNLQVKASEISKDLSNPKELTEQLDDLLAGSKNFNSLSIVNREGIVLATSPELGLVGKKLETPGPQEALMRRTELISNPYKAATGRLLVLISTPLWSEENKYLGFLSGTIYLQEENSLHDILGEHFSTDGSYVWVVDRKGKLIYHPDFSRIGTSIAENEIVQKIGRHESGAQKVVYSDGTEYLASYTYIESSDWAVVSQTPYEVIVKPAIGMINQMLLYALPFVLFFYVVTLFLTNRLASPLRKLAMYSKDLKEKEGHVEQTEIPTWYFEAKQLNETIHEYAKWQQQTVDDYKERSYTDPLTGLKNRRYGKELMAKWVKDEQPFCMIMLDIDHFKRVNDTYGHQVGDKVLQFLSAKMIEVVQDKGECIRLGGEEFIILLANNELEQAMSIAEQLRYRISSTLSPTRGYITISEGVGSYHVQEETVKDLYDRVDKALYRAKSEGRNRVFQAE